MAKYKGRPATVNKPADEVFNKISDIAAYQQRLESLPTEAREKLGEVRFSDDSIIITAQPVGEIRFKVVEKQAPTTVRLAAEQSPVPFGIAINIKPVSDQSTEIATELDVEIPMMLKPLVGGKLQEAADKFSDLITVFFA